MNPVKIEIIFDGDASIVVIVNGVIKTIPHGSGFYLPNELEEIIKRNLCQYYVPDVPDNENEE